MFGGRHYDSMDISSYIGPVSISCSMPFPFDSP